MKCAVPTSLDGASSITYSLFNVHRLEAALSGLRISKGTLIPGYSPEFAPITVDLGIGSEVTIYSVFMQC